MTPFAEKPTAIEHFEMKKLTKVPKWTKKVKIVEKLIIINIESFAFRLLEK